MTDRRPVSLGEQNRHTGESSHEYILTEIKNRIKGNPYKAKNFAETVRLLRGLRVEADYRERIFHLEECIDCKDKADSLLLQLNTYFGNL